MVCNNFEMPYLQRRERIYSVYIMASKKNGTLYIGVTSDLPSRVMQHKNGANEGFTKNYNVKTLVWFENFGEIDRAIQREKTMKKWPRQWKINLIELKNPEWNDLITTIL